TLNFDLASSRYNAEKSDQFVREFFSKLNTQPGIQSAAGTAQLPMGNSASTISFDIEGRVAPKGQSPSALIGIVTQLSFETMKIPILEGRTFDERDQRKALPVIIISQAFAQKYFPGENSIGKRIQIGANDQPGDDPWREVVGVVGDVRQGDLSTPPEPMYYV